MPTSHAWLAAADRQLSLGVVLQGPAGGVEVCTPDKQCSVRGMGATTPSLGPAGVPCIAKWVSEAALLGEVSMHASCLGWRSGGRNLARCCQPLSAQLHQLLPAFSS